MISLICMSTHKAMATRCLSDHQAAYGQPAIRALATAPLRRLALSVLFTIATNSYQTTCTVSERTFNKRQHANARHGVDFSLFTHYDNSHIMQHFLSSKCRPPPPKTKRQINRRYLYLKYPGHVCNLNFCHFLLIHIPSNLHPKFIYTHIALSVGFSY